MTDPFNTEFESITDTESTVVFTPTDSLSIDSETGSDDALTKGNQLKDYGIPRCKPTTSAKLRANKNLAKVAQKESMSFLCAGSDERLKFYLLFGLGALNALVIILIFDQGLYIGT